MAGDVRGGLFATSPNVLRRSSTSTRAYRRPRGNSSPRGLAPKQASNLRAAPPVVEMAGDDAPTTSARTTRAKRRLVTSCLECYRRKQKCDRGRPCNFCSARGVPEICRYHTSLDDSTVKSDYKDPGHVLPLSKSPETETTIQSTINDSTASLLDQVGYSATSDLDDFRFLKEYGSENLATHPTKEKLANITDINTYLTLIARLPSEKATLELLRVFFSIEAWSFPILDEQHFRLLHRQFQSHSGSAFSSGTPVHSQPTPSIFSPLLFSVLAVALQFVPPASNAAIILGFHTSSQCDRASQWYFDTGQQLIELFKQQKPTTTSIQFYLTKMVWLKNCGRGNKSWQTLGVALRQAQEIDLHQIQKIGAQASGVSLEQTLARLWELEHRKRLWARIFVMDSHMAVALGRPRGIHREDCSTPAPLDCDYPTDPSQTVPLSTNHTHEPPNSFSSVMFSITLGHKYHDLMSLRASKLDLMDYSRVQALHQEVRSLLSDLPPALRPFYADISWDCQRPQLPAIRQRLLTTANIFLLALHRPLVPTHVASRYAAVEAAFELLQSQQRLFNMMPSAQHKLYGHSFYTIHAGILLTTIVVKHLASDPDTCTKAFQELQLASIRLALMKERSPLAKTGESILNRCCAVIEAKITSPLNVGSAVGADSDEQFTTAVDYLQDFGLYMSDQDTQEMAALLANPADSASTQW